MPREMRELACNVIGQNMTAVVGFQANPNYRGTVDIIETCLFTILACSWSILHMNLPGPTDGWWKKQFRMALWTLITIFCPEFILAHALVERTLVFMDMATMRELEKSNKLEGWEVESETFPELIVRKIQSFAIRLAFETPVTVTNPQQSLGESVDSATTRQEISREDQTQELEAADIHNNESVGDAEIQEDNGGDTRERHVSTDGDDTREMHVSVNNVSISNQTWTLSHVYYANMGGIRMIMLPSELPPNSDVSNDNTSTYLTTNMLIDTLQEDPAGKQNSFYPLKSLRISKGDIDDKSNADAFTKSIALMQILWLVPSLITRKLRGLASSQLEIMTLAFALLAIVTYLAYFHKPQNVGQATTIEVPIECVNDTDVPAILSRHFDCLRPHSFFKLVFSPFVVRDESSTKYDPRNRKRVPNDNVNYKAFACLSIHIALATMFFGGLHCLAWHFTFPSRWETWTWRSASLVTAFTPAIVLIVHSVLIYNANLKYKKIMNTPDKFAKFADLLKDYELATRVPTWFYRIFTIVGIILYVLSRFVTIYVAFSSLRSMPADVYYTTWARYFPLVQ